ncbi:MAG: CapA family protein [Bdellovibrionaceae bacterium]|nr:CapA family protein [Pseudobdellovibrionaceae bacterium]
MFRRHLLKSVLTLTASVTMIPKAQASCSANGEVKIAAVGDILVHGALYAPANQSRQGFSSIWSSLTPLFKSADITYGNFEATAARGLSQSGRQLADPGRVYDCRHPVDKDGRPNTKRNGGDAVYCVTNFLFNYHPDMIGALKQSGFSVLSTANNHSMDRGRLGVDKTVESMQEYGMPFTGTRHSKQNNAFHAITNAKGWKVAWLGCADAVNWSGAQPQVLRCNSEATMSLIRQLSKDRSIDAVIVTPHWGGEYQTTPSSSQTRLAKRFADAGATAVIGNHAHVIQPLRIVKSSDQRDVPVAYSLGNFVAGQKGIERQMSIVLFLDLSRSGGVTKVRGISAVPVVRVGLKIVSLDSAIANGGIAGQEREAAQILRSRMSEARILRPSQVCQ